MNPGEISRRGWFARLGGAAALARLNSAPLLAEGSAALPPGLYQPSLQHFAHAMKAAAAPAAAEASPRYFSPEDFALVVTVIALVLEEQRSAPAVGEIAAWIDLIAGRAEEVRRAARALSPAHRRLAVDYYGEDTVRELESEDVQRILRDGLAALKQAGFAALDRTSQYAHMTTLEDAGDPFLVWIKHRTLDGFYTSRWGLSELDYGGNAFYSRSPGCDHEGGHH